MICRLLCGYSVRYCFQFCGKRHNMSRPPGLNSSAASESFMDRINWNFLRCGRGKYLMKASGRSLTPGPRKINYRLCRSEKARWTRRVHFAGNECQIFSESEIYGSLGSSSAEKLDPAPISDLQSSFVIIHQLLMSHMMYTRRTYILHGKYMYQVVIKFFGACKYAYCTMYMIYWKFFI